MFLLQLKISLIRTQNRPWTALEKAKSHGKIKSLVLNSEANWSLRMVCSSGTSLQVIAEIKHRPYNSFLIIFAQKPSRFGMVIFKKWKLELISHMWLYYVNFSEFVLYFKDSFSRTCVDFFAFWRLWPSPWACFVNAPFTQRNPTDRFCETSVPVGGLAVLFALPLPLDKVFD